MAPGNRPEAPAPCAPPRIFSAGSKRSDTRAPDASIREDSSAIVASVSLDIVAEESESWIIRPITVTSSCIITNYN